ncbi:WD40 repeat domain-containing protein [Chryseobacterium joostei]|uniref:WD40 repeat domain-containing protein n=1 Tax=Chryseobacterium joostei TaxID=112234 RepID=A0A1N7IBR3_9FLAO|nr:MULTISPECIES: WD40 repeat domain-containing protein [Chryseobacterium]AZB01840.1 WD40 repeat domain-containing protein [Chryseobacterium joostei]SIS34518.1 hypothetical protein SAMN05421768_10416 [Chryseobacterium joostei]HCM36297.1 WD40 repeat domain-containing protein [Chryseobacterium sp.]
MNEIKHQLIDYKSDKIINLILKDRMLISETGKTDKFKTTKKEFSSNEDALKNFYKKEWESLKKGFVLNNENAKIGQPVLHKFLGGVYTGAISFAPTPKGIFVYKDESENEGIKGSLNLIDLVGNVLKTIELPKPLAWNIEYRKERNSLIMDIDHYIYEFDIENGVFHNIGKENSHIDSFVSVANDKTAFATLNQLSIVDNHNKILHTKSYEIEIINGSSPFCGKLSKDGNLLAFHNKEGEIQIFDTKTGNLLKKIVADFRMVYQFEFADNNQLLVVREQYGTWGMRYFDLSTADEIQIKELEIPEYTKDVNAFCFNEDQTKLVLLQRADVYVFDFTDKKLLHSFKIEHLVKSCKIKFVAENLLCVRTDYGCFSIYNV